MTLPSNSQTGSDNDTLYCFYDLLHSPITFDFLHFLAIAECYRKERGLKKTQFVITTGEDGEFRKSSEKDHALGQSQKIWRLRHILETACWLVPSCTGVSTSLDRSMMQMLHACLPAERVFPVGYRPDNPVNAFAMRHLKKLHDNGIDVQVLEASLTARARARDWITAQKIDRPIVALSIRFSPLFSRKNADLHAWAELQSHIWEAGFQPVIIPDTYLALRGLYPNVNANVHVFYQGALDYELRAGLFDEAFMTMSKHGGPAMYNYLRRGARSVIFLGAKAHPSKRAFETIWGVPWGEPAPWFTDVQRVVYQDDSADLLKRHFDEVLALSR